VGKRSDPAPERIIADIRWMGLDTGTTYATANDCIRAGNTRCSYVADRVTYRGQLPRRDGGGSGDRDTTHADTTSLRDVNENPRFGMRGVGEAWECLHHAGVAQHPDTDTAPVPDDSRRGLHMDLEEV
jgi:hypothetical protein